ncbi:hypothetical protein L207DRAFT_238362 [Hyaloscypha variabilis F]|uniref:Uncharacterized protein n=1 Tax=Hyaloscypha variabilis (strain UAMH 11265 / GT02V1 / F) TaxID=1149755 RepID=A0A2J6QT19_HYAVF|nr:hypothetical protein L207DRAFT_238362 [Hyaloscypha variabilis F]
MQLTYSAKRTANVSHFQTSSSCHFGRPRYQAPPHCCSFRDWISGVKTSCSLAYRWRQRRCRACFSLIWLFCPSR